MRRNEITMYAAAMGNTITAAFQCLLAISVKGFFAVAFVCFAPVLYLVQMFEYTLLFGRSALFFVGGCGFSSALVFPLDKITVVLLYNTFHFSENTHKRLYIGITGFLQNIGQFFQLLRYFLFGLLYLLGKTLTLFAFEYSFYFGKL